MAKPNTIPKAPPQHETIIVDDSDTVDINAQIGANRAPKTPKPSPDIPEAPPEQPRLSHQEEFAMLVPSENRALFNRIVEEVKKADILNFLLFGKADFPFKLGPVDVTFQIMDADNKYHVDQYMYGKDPFDLFNEEDERALAKLMAYYDIDRKEAAEKYKEEFTVDMARKRYTLVVLSESVKTINGKTLGASIKERVQTVAGFSVVLIDQLTTAYELTEIAVKCLLTDPDYVKN